MDQPDHDDNNGSSSQNKRKHAEEEEGDCPTRQMNGNSMVEDTTATTASSAATGTTANTTAVTATTTTITTTFVPITREGDRPQKKFYRQRAHCNPLSHNDSFDYPRRPDLMDWTTDAFYPGLVVKKQNDNDSSCTNRGNSNGTVPVTVAVAYAQPTVLDVGCGFGGLTLALARLLPHEIILGMEIRAKVTEYVRLRIAAARKDPSTALLLDNDDDDDNVKQQSTATPPEITANAAPTSSAAVVVAAAATTTAEDITTTTTVATKPEGARETTQQQQQQQQPPALYQNAAVLRTNSMKFLPHYFAKHSLRKLFFCFPDPHFKRKNHARRIISDRLLTEYAYVLQPCHGKLYCITDVRELHEWHVQKCNAHPCLECIVVVHPQDAAASSPPDLVERAMRDDVCIRAMMHETEEGKKVHRNGGDKYFAVYRRRRVATGLSTTTKTTTILNEEEDAETPGTTTSTAAATLFDSSNFFA
jgi:tRNA (guanine-N7-)-methyltransferase